MIEGIEFKLEWISKGNQEEVKLLLKVKGWNVVIIDHYYRRL